MRIDHRLRSAAAATAIIGACALPLPALAQDSTLPVVTACFSAFNGGIRLIAPDRQHRFLGKVGESLARCRGGARAVAGRALPWVDWTNYWADGDASSKDGITDPFDIPILRHLLNRNTRGIDGALTDIEYQRMELIKFNLFDNTTYEQYVNGRTAGADTIPGSILKTWKEMRLPANHPNFKDLLILPGDDQQCKGALVRFRTVSGICNDIRNPAMGSAGMLFGRNVQFESTYPDLGLDQFARNRHGGRISLLTPDPQVISRRLFTRDETATPNCNQGKGTPGTDSDCSYRKAPFMNVIAAFWIQFMTHDWFSHLDNARNDRGNILANLGCTSERVNNVDQPITPERAAALGCRPADKMEAGLIADREPAPTFSANGTTVLARSPRTSQNLNTAWWDASQIYGYDDASRRRMRRDPEDSAKLAMVPAHTGTAGDEFGYLPVFNPPCDPAAPRTGCDPIQPEWTGQEAAAFADNWSIGMSFLTNVFVREHNIIVDKLRAKGAAKPTEDSGLRNPDDPATVITYAQLSNDELFEIARLVVAAEIAKIHTTEWTPQLLYNEPLHVGMNANWSGLFTANSQDPTDALARDATKRIVNALASSPRAKEANQFYSVLLAGPGMVGTGNDLPYPAGINDGVNHFGSPFNFPEEFISVYRLHPLVPDMIEFRDLANPNSITRHIPVIDTFRGKATDQIRSGGLANWALSMGRQRLGLLLLRNHPQFLQNLDLRPRLDTTLDVAALDIIRDREHGVPRFNEFRRQIGLKQLTSFDDFLDKGVAKDSADYKQQADLVKTLREIYGTHVCDASKQITTAQLDDNGGPINDCLGRPNGSTVDNIEDVDIVVGFLAETTRPHGFAISETQFHIFIINASRRLYSDRFFTSSFRPEFYTKLGYDWVMHNGPDGIMMESGSPNGHTEEVSAFKRVLLRTMPELAAELKGVVNAFDPWARDRGDYYSLDWKPRADAKDDPAFRQ